MIASAVGVLLSLELSSLASTVRDVPGVLKRYTKSDGSSPVTGLFWCEMFFEDIVVPATFYKRVV